MIDDFGQTRWNLSAFDDDCVIFTDGNSVWNLRLLVVIGRLELLKGFAYEICATLESTEFGVHNPLLLMKDMVSGFVARSPDLQTVLCV